LKETHYNLPRERETGKKGRKRRERERERERRRGISRWIAGLPTGLDVLRANYDEFLP